jgi:mycolic acid cyclopropane synthetase
MRKLTFVVVFTALGLVAQKPSGFPANSQATAGAVPESLAPYLPTPKSIVDEMLKAGELKAGETMFDLGSGDGRIVIAAAREYKAHAIGIELDDALASASIQKIAELGLDKNAHIIQGDLMKQDYHSADLITVYLWPEARVVSHDFEMGTWVATKTITIPDDGTGRSHTLFLYIR